MDTLSESERPLDAIRDYLDRCIDHWRKRREAGEAMAVYYVDAFQSVRASVFGNTKP